MKEIIVVQVGQCGNQIGHKFWQNALEEFRACKDKPSQETLSSFFRIVDDRGNPILKGQPTENIQLKCRSLLIDTEERVLDRLYSSQMRHYFDDTLNVRAVSGAGNNWACGYFEYGDELLDQMKDKLRRSGGGTGAGLGSRLTEEMRYEYPEIHSFSSCVIPSSVDDVNVSPYNSLLTVNSISQFTHGIFPIQNSALQWMVQKATEKAGKKTNMHVLGQQDSKDKEKMPYEAMNNIAARVLTDLTSSMRFGGSLNLDLNEITTNFVPFEKAKFICTSISPLAQSSDRRQLVNLRPMFDEVFQKDNQLISAAPLMYQYLNCGLFARGESIDISDMRREFKIGVSQIRMPWFNPNAFKVGVCSQPPPGVHHSLLCVANNTCVRLPLTDIIDRFGKLFKHRAFIHHFTEYGLSIDDIRHARDNLQDIVDFYGQLEKNEIPTHVEQSTPLF
ncbi:putative Tubulin epsilon chain [Blattamonas nauphoetae]|uniref:Tubulin epsilon chain n=1 Tax=Blattamonas nauphoetae TaxID=2049346 RepID=A0ABQ9YL92_9EUKA|nr:putative Tubulin epsilon chain [Blattamonas nauphoetae]